MNKNIIRLLLLVAVAIGAYFLWSNRMANSIDVPNTQGNIGQIPSNIDGKQADEVVASLQTADAQRLSAFFDEEVAFTLMDEDELYSADEARDALQQFFEAHPSEGFRVLHQGKSGSGKSRYLIGNHRTTAGVYRFYLSIEADKITEIRIE
ncbi:MAG: DUF4783 domain-containing protein [Bacteroidota bacterium]